MQKYATCHPDRFVHARGLCSSCYGKSRNGVRRERYATDMEYRERSRLSVKTYQKSEKAIISRANQRDKARKKYQTDEEYRSRERTRLSKLNFEIRSTKEGRIKSLLRSSKHTARGKSLEYNIDYNYILSIWVDICPVLNVVFDMETGKGKNPFAPSIDRIDSSKGYIKGNIQIISWRANQIKLNSTPEERRLLHEYDIKLGLV